MAARPLTSPEMELPRTELARTVAPASSNRSYPAARKPVNAPLMSLPSENAKHRGNSPMVSPSMWQMPEHVSHFYTPKLCRRLRRSDTWFDPPKASHRGSARAESFLFAVSTVAIDER